MFSPVKPTHIIVIINKMLTTKIRQKRFSTLFNQMHVSEILVTYLMLAGDRVFQCAVLSISNSIMLHFQ